MTSPADTTLPPYASDTLLGLAPPRCAEDRLMLAVLLDAVAVLREHATGVCPHSPKLVVGTARWFGIADATWPLSYVNVCRTLGLDAGALRDGLRRELSDLGARGLLESPGTRVLPFGDVATPAASSVRRRSSGRGRA